MKRREYLDWLRGIAVLIMIEAHTLDAWTRVEDRGPAYGWAIIVGGFGAPLFLFLAGITLALAAGARLRVDWSPAEVAARARRRGWQIFGLALLFRLQSWAISGGAWDQVLFKVDILNVMGVAMVAAAMLWGLGWDRPSRALLLAAAAVAAAMITPIVRATPLLDALPAQVEWYLRAAPGLAMFPLFPWAGFLLAGGAVGLWLDGAGAVEDQRRTILALAVLGPALAIAGYAASFLPTIYAETSFWTGSPTFFFLRLGILIGAVPLAYAWNAVFTGRSPLREFGVASLFVYWIHVEMAYGVVSLPLHRALTLGGAAAACAVLSLLLFGLVRLKERLSRPARLRREAATVERPRLRRSAHPT